MGALADRPLVVNVIHHRHDVWQKKEVRPPLEENLYGDGLPLGWWKVKASGACWVTRRSGKAALKFAGGETTILGVLGG
jgi:hypothetical protein